MINKTAKIYGILAKRAVSPLLCFVLGLLYSLPFVCEGLWIFSYISLFLFFAVIFTGDRLKKLFRHCLTFYFGFYLVLYSFLAYLYPFESFGFTAEQAAIVLVGACLLIPMFHATLHSLVMLILKVFRGNLRLAALAAPLVWMTSEFVLASGTLAFPWGTVALSQTGFLPMVQTASLFGDYFITLVVVGSCSLLAYAFVDAERAFAIGGAALILSNLLAGTVLYFLPTDSTKTVTVAAVQGDVRMNEKWDTNNLPQITANYIGLISEAAESGATVVVLPESAIPEYFTEYNAFGATLRGAAMQNGVSLVVGVLQRGDGYAKNSVISIGSDGDFDLEYNKRHPVPFGEFIPYRDVLQELLPFLKDMNLSGMNLQPGTEAYVLDCDGDSYGTLVCFDSIFPSLAIDEVKNGAEIMTVVTNDSWFYDSTGTYQHYRHAKLRAIECGRYFIQAGNTGISGVIDQKGNTLVASKPMTKACVTAQAELIQTNTLYACIGDAVLYAAFVLLAAAIIFNIVKKGKRNANVNS